MTMCKDCKYYCGGTKGGDCRKNPPTVTILEVKKCERDGSYKNCWKEVESYTEFPTVMVDMSCGEFTAIKPEPAFDAEKVRKLIRNHLEAARDYGSHYPGSSTRTLNEDGITLRKSDIALLAALGIEDK